MPFTISPSPVNATGQASTLTLTGTGTSWSSASDFRALTSQGISIQGVLVATVLDTTHATVTLTLSSSSAGTFTIMVDGETAAVQVLTSTGAGVAAIEFPFTVYQAGVPVTGLNPATAFSFGASFKRLTDQQAVATAGTFAEHGGGIYVFRYDPGAVGNGSAAGVLDMGATYTNNAERYIPIVCPLEVQLVNIYVDAQVSLVKAKTDALPTNPALKTDIPAITAIADGVLDRVDGIEPGWTFRQVMRLLSSAFLGNSTTNGSTFRDINNIKNRLVGTSDIHGNRTVTTRDAT